MNVLKFKTKSFTPYQILLEIDTELDEKIIEFACKKLIEDRDSRPFVDTVFNSNYNSFLSKLRNTKNL